MLKWPHPKRLKTTGYLSILYKTAQSASLNSLCSVTKLKIEPEVNRGTFGNEKQTSLLTLTDPHFCECMIPYFIKISLASCKSYSRKSLIPEIIKTMSPRYGNQKIKHIFKT